jgi:hypothetical protein
MMAGTLLSASPACVGAFRRSCGQKVSTGGFVPYVWSPEGKEILSPKVMALSFELALLLGQLPKAANDNGATNWQAIDHRRRNALAFQAFV